jgi:hypothetical protein
MIMNLIVIRYQIFGNALNRICNYPPQHRRSQKVKAYLERNSDIMIVKYLQEGSADLNA